jgi:hypothetical protein
MKKLIPILLALSCAGCVALRMDQSKGTASYYRLGAQDISDLHASKIGTDGSQLKVDLGRAQIGEPTIMQPDQWAGIIENYLAAGLAQSALKQIAEDILKDKAANLDIDDVKGKIGDALDKEKDKNEPPKNVDDWTDWPAGETRYHIYAENNGTPNQRGLWKPNSDSRPGEPVMLLPAHMSKTGVEKVVVGDSDITDKVRKYPTDLLPILGNGLRLHYNVPKVGANVPVVVTLSDGSKYRATVVNGTKRQDPLTFEKVKDADPGDDPPIIDEPDEEDPTVTHPPTNNPRYAPGVVEIPAQFLRHGNFVELRFEKCSLANGLLKPTENPLVFTLPPPSDEVWRWTDEQGRTPPRCIGTRARFSDGSLYDGFVYDYHGSYPMPISTTGRAFWVKMN